MRTTSTVSPLSLEGICKSLGGREIVKDLSFELKPGEVFGFLGPNGAGKTTTIRMIAGLIFPTKGRITIMGHDITRERTQAMRHVGAIVENPELYKFLTGRQNLDQSARLIGGIYDDPAHGRQEQGGGDGKVTTLTSPRRGVSKQRIEQVIDIVGLHDRIKDKVSKYSLGMRQRLGIAQALLNRPSLLILDEPTNGLDPSGIRELRELMRKLAYEEGTAVFVSSHLLSEIEMMCDRVAIIDQGRVVAIENVDSIAEQEIPEVLMTISAGMLEATTETLVGIIEACEGVTAVRLNHDLEGAASLTSNNKTPLWRVTVSTSAENIPALIRHLVTEGIDVHGVQQHKITLEEHFLAVTGGVSVG